MKLFLHIKAWQLFLLLMIIPLFTSGDSIFSRIMILIWTGIYFGWIYTVGFFMHKILDVRLKPDIRYFQYSCLFNVGVQILVILFGGFTINQDNYHQYGSSIWVLLPLLFYGFWSIIYVFLFAARMLQSVSEGRLVNRSDSLKAFFGFWFFPIGIWYVQRDVLRIMIDHSKNDDVTYDING